MSYKKKESPTKEGMKYAKATDEQINALMDKWGTYHDGTWKNGNGLPKWPTNIPDIIEPKAKYPAYIPDMLKDKPAFDAEEFRKILRAVMAEEFKKMIKGLLTQLRDEGLLVQAYRPDNNQIEDRTV